MKKSWIQKMTLICLATICLHQMRAADTWYDPIVERWQYLKALVFDFYYKWRNPETYADIKKYQQGHQKKVADELNIFLGELQQFIPTLKTYEVEKTIGWPSLIAPHRNLLIQLDSIADVDMPKTIYDATVPLRNEKLNNSLVQAFQFLKPQLRWSDIETQAGLTSKTVPVSALKNIQTYLKTKQEHETTIKYDAYLKWIELTIKNKQNDDLVNLIPAATTSTADLVNYLDILRDYKAHHVYEKLNNAQQFANQIVLIYRSLGAIPPDTLWLTDSNIYKK